MRQNKENIPGILFAAPNSGSGKTLITCGFLQAIINRGLRPCAFKCGPDYIDPMFHRRVIGIPGANLDSFFLDGEAVARHYRETIKKSGCDMAVTEGVMGYYDGTGGISTRASSYDISRLTKTPVILIVDQKGSSLSLAAVVKGFVKFRKDSRIKGVIFNRVSGSLFQRLAAVTEEETGIPALGFLPESPDYRFESRHLGLYMPGEIGELKEKLNRLAGQMEKTVDIDKILSIARSECPIASREEVYKTAGRVVQKPVIGVARDEAFCFYYQENLDMLEEQGAKLVFFSPLHDEKPPEGLQGLLLGGGYPESYAKGLSENTSMLLAVRELWEQGIPVLAECGGFLYLHRELEGIDGRFYKMAGAFDCAARNSGKLGRFGYISLTAPDGKQIRGHEFHYWDSDDPGTDWLAEKPDSSVNWQCIHEDGARICGFPHLFYPSAPAFTGRWLEQCAGWNAGERRK